MVNYMKTDKRLTGNAARPGNKAEAASQERFTGLPIEGSNPTQIKDVCHRFHLLRQDLTRLTGYSLRAVDSWATGKAPAAPAKKQLTELVRLFDALADLMDARDIGPWLKTANPAFANSTPLQVIERGEQDRIWRMIYRLETGEPE